MTMSPRDRRRWLVGSSGSDRPVTNSTSPGRRTLSIVDSAAPVPRGGVGSGILFLRIASPQVGPAWAAETRLAIGPPPLLVAGRATLRVLGRFASFLVAGALFSAVPFTLIAVATVTLRPALTSLLNAATPLFTAAIAVGFMGQRISARVAAGLAVGVIAVVVLVGWSPLEPGATTILAVAAGLGAPASYAVAGNFVRARLVDIEPLELATGMLTAGAVIALPVALLSGHPGHRPSTGRSRLSAWVSCRQPSPGHLLPGLAPDDADRGQHGDLHRARVRPDLELDRTCRAGRRRPGGRVRAHPRQLAARAGDHPVRPAVAPRGPPSRRRIPLRRQFAHPPGLIRRMSNQGRNSQDRRRSIPAGTEEEDAHVRQEPL